MQNIFGKVMMMEMMNMGMMMPMNFTFLAK
ncbi:hypothetical protein Dip510_002107 [Elusimicrobium posterum]